MSIPMEDLRKVFAQWTTGVTVVTARDGDTIHGMTVSAFTEVSLDPPLVLVCADETSNTHPVIAGGGVFAVNILSVEQEAISNRFASKKDEWRRFDGLECETAATGAPLLPGTVAALDCRVEAAFPAGDHIIYVGRVAAIRHDPTRTPLLYAQGQYGRFA